MSLNATTNLLMIRPVLFGLNAQTAVDNFYQDTSLTSGEKEQEAAVAEFDAFVAKLRSVGVNVLVLQDTKDPHTPDSIFPNNWISMHSDGTLVLYPMKAENRRLERIDAVEDLLENAGFEVKEILDISANELEDIFLEGTGSIVFDHGEKIAYLARSQRADEGLFEILCEELGYEPVVFSAFQETQSGLQQIYHTNVLMCVTDEFVVVCLDAVRNQDERAQLEERILNSGKGILEITEAQKHEFAGNMLLVQGEQERPYLVMSSRAHAALDQEQLDIITEYYDILSSDLTTIETLGGGSARCMLAENYLPKIDNK
jgi:hypothetical protein